MECARRGARQRPVARHGAETSGAFSLKPHRQETLKLSSNPDCATKVRDIVGLYMGQPAHTIVLFVDEKSKFRALDRRQTLFPIRLGRPVRRSHDYTRQGTTSLFAALDRAIGQAIGECYPQHRAQEFRQFLDTAEARVPRNGQASKNFTLHMNRRLAPKKGPGQTGLTGCQEPFLTIPRKPGRWWHRFSNDQPRDRIRPTCGGGAGRPVPPNQPQGPPSRPAPEWKSLCEQALCNCRSPRWRPSRYRYRSRSHCCFQR